MMDALIAGTATNDGINGADWYLKFNYTLPDYYISRTDAKMLGWRKKKHNFHIVAPNKMLYGEDYYNDDNKLPMINGRQWYEADINYSAGKRNGERILFSNDGLIFVTYDHYETFIEIL